MDQDFLNNEIYKYLVDNNNTLVSIIDTTYQHCENILGEIPKEFSNYTLHDIHHAIRVINYMTEFVKPNISEYSDFHLALILLAGLLHDTGMSVSDEEKEEILSKIITENNKDNQQEIFQDYIRERHSKRVRKTLDSCVIDKETGSTLSSIFILDSYNFANDIALICQSHTESIEWIKENLGVSKNLTKYTYNPQQIALLLKLGDNLDIDARRAPYSLLKLLAIKGYSKTEWEKHSPISNYDKVKYLGNNRFHIFFDGECDNAFIYRKVMEHILWLQNTCSEISSISSRYEKPFCFDFDEKIEIRIETIGFESTELQFLLDYSSVLKLLMGEQIYGEKKAGLRELLQNSIDAIMVMKEKLSNKSTTNYQPTIWIEMNKDNNTISVSDNGIGMSKTVLEKYFFNIGKSYYTSKDYKKLKLNYSAIGHFGIGFLSCFMLSSNVLLETKTIGQNPIIIEFERMSQFVTKLKDRDCIFDEGHGTRIHLSYNEIIPQIFESETALIAYVKNIVLIDGYKLQIINSDNEVLDIAPLNNSDVRLIATEKFDIKYSLSKPFTFWRDFTYVWPFCHSLLLCCHSYDFDCDFGFELKYPIIVDLLEVYRVIDSLYRDYNDEKISDYKYDIFNYQKCRNNTTRYFLAIMIQNTENLNELKTNINRFAFKKAFNGTSIIYNYLPYSLPESGGKIRQKMSPTVLIGLEKNDYRLLREKTYKHHYAFLDSIYDEFIGLSAKSFRRHNIRVLKADGEDLFMPIGSKNSVHSLIYMHGILVKSGNIRLAIANLNAGVVLKHFAVNVKSDDFELNISRNEFSNKSKVKLNYEITKEIYKDIISNSDGKFSCTEKQLLIKLYELIENKYA